MDKSATPKQKATGLGKQVGYIVSIIILVILLYIFEHLYEWGVPFLTEEYNDLLWYIRLSFYASIAMNVVFLMYDPKWLKHLLQAAANVFGALSVIMFYVIFPFDFHADQVSKIVRIILLVIMIIMLLSIVIELIKAIRALTRRETK